MLAEPWFREKVAARWREVSPAVHGVPAYVAARAETVSGAADRNFAPVASGGAGQPLTLTFMEQADSTVLKGSWVAEVAHLEGWRSEEHTSELQSLMRISYAVFCFKKTKTQTATNNVRH